MEETIMTPGFRFMSGALAASAFVVGCATTQQVKVSPQSVQASCAFLGAAVCAKLTPQNTGAAGGDQPVANLRYINPNARWTQYSKVLITPITFWAGDS